MNRKSVFSPPRQLLALAALACATACVPAGPDVETVRSTADLPNEKAAVQSRYTEAEEAVYLARFKALAEGGSGSSGLSAYDPLEPVAGATEVTAFPASTAVTLSQSAIEEATAYAADRNSSAFIIWRDGAIEQEAYFGDYTADTPLVSKSLSKPVTALIVGRALQQGYIQSLDQPVADFITEWKGDAEREKIKIRNLLDMRAGFLRQNFATDPEDILNRAYLHPRHDEVIINDYPLTHEPGTRYEYSNATSEMIAPVIERATGMRYSEYLTKALLEPLGAAGGSIWVNREGGTAHSGCCMLVPARSYLKMGVLVLQDGIWEGTRLLPEGYVTEMRTATAQNVHYGLGLWLAGPYVERRGFANPSIEFGKVLHSEPYADKDIYLFDGNGNQTVTMIPSKNIVVLRLGGRPPRDAEWDNTVLPNMLIRDLSENGGEDLPEPQGMTEKQS